MPANLIGSRWVGGLLSFFIKSSGSEILKLGTSGVKISALGLLSFGAAEASTIASGVLTVTGEKTLIRVTSESGTSDQLDSIAGFTPSGGEVLVLIPKDTDTITVDDANIDLGAATRAVAPGGVIVLHYNSTAASWQELFFLAGADNV